MTGVFQFVNAQKSSAQQLICGTSNNLYVELNHQKPPNFSLLYIIIVFLFMTGVLLNS